LFDSHRRAAPGAPLRKSGQTATYGVARQVSAAARRSVAIDVALPSVNRWVADEPTPNDRKSEPCPIKLSAVQILGTPCS
jgi:hypothetical protein